MNLLFARALWTRPGHRTVHSSYNELGNGPKIGVTEGLAIFLPLFLSMEQFE